MARERQKPPLSVEEQDYRQKILAWLDNILASRDITVPELAEQAGLTPSTIYRWQKQPVNPDLRSLRKVSAKFGVPLPGEEAESVVMVASHITARVFAENDVEPIAQPPQPDLHLESNESHWLIHSRTLDLAGCLPGDIIVMDMRATPTAGDIVVAQRYSEDFTTAKTLIRLYFPPYLMVKSTDPAVMEVPLLVDNNRTKIMGTVTSLRRERQR